jgi:hypothetical protein
MAKITQSLDDINGDVLPEGTPTTTVTITDPRNGNPRSRLTCLTTRSRLF